MSDQELHNDYFELISSYLSGNAGDAEVRQLEEWVMAAPENKATFMAFKKAWMLSGMKDDTDQVKVNQLWEQTNARLSEQKKLVDLKVRRRNWLGIAASIALILAAGLWIVVNYSSSRVLAFQTADQVNTIDLPDGSQVLLNRFSSLRFQTSKDGSQRQVELNGNAFFEVARNEAQPFVIQTQGVEIQVLGTAFLVDSRAEQADLQVIVQSGTVAVKADTSVILEADEKAVFNKQEQSLNKQKNEDPNYLSFTTNTLVFENTPLEQAIFALNRHFNTNITIDSDEIKDCPLTAAYENQSLAAILKIIETSLPGIQVERVGEQFILSGASCD